MKIFKRARVTRAFTWVDLLLVIFVVAGAAFLLLPALAKSKPRPRINCFSNLKQVGLAFRLWAGDNDDHFPMTLVTNPAYSPLFTNGLTTLRVFQLMSNELSDPKIVWCPQDGGRYPTNFFSDFRATNISYFVGVDADQTHPRTFLAGDFNITNGTILNSNILELTSNRPSGWTNKRHFPAGNILFSDGSVQSVNSASLQQYIVKTGLGTNKLLFP